MVIFKPCSISTARCSTNLIMGYPVSEVCGSMRIDTDIFYEYTVAHGVCEKFLNDANLNVTKRDAMYS